MCRYKMNEDNNATPESHQDSEKESDNSPTAGKGKLLGKKKQ